MKRTRALQILDEKRVSYRTGAFEATDFTAEEVTEKLDVPLPQVFKTLIVHRETNVARDGRTPLAVLVPGDRELNLKKLASLVGVKRTEMVSLDDLQRLTGYLKGGVSPLGTTRPVDVVIDSTALNFEWISVSAGQRGLQIFIDPNVLAKTTNARIGDVSGE